MPPTQPRHAGWGLGDPSRTAGPTETGPRQTPDRGVSYKKGAWHSIQLPPDLKARLKDDPRTFQGHNIHADDRPHIRPTNAGLSLIRGGPLPDRTVGVAQPDPHRFTVEAHGDANGIRIGDTPLSPRDLADILRGTPGYRAGMPVRLLVCDAGGPTPDGSPNFASRLAEELGVPVLAPNSRAWVDNFGNMYAADNRARLEGDPSSPRPSFDEPGQWVTHNPDGTTAVHDSPFPPGHQPEWVRTDHQTGNQYTPQAASSRGAWSPWDMNAPPEFRNPGGPGQNGWRIGYDQNGNQTYGHMAGGQFVPHTFRDTNGYLHVLGQVDPQGRWVPNHADPDGYRRPNGHYDNQGRWVPHGRHDHLGRWIPVVTDGVRFHDTGRWVDQPGRPTRWESFFPPAPPATPRAPVPPHVQQPQHAPPRTTPPQHTPAAPRSPETPRAGGTPHTPAPSRTAETPQPASRQHTPAPHTAGPPRTAGTPRPADPSRPWSAAPTSRSHGAVEPRQSFGPRGPDFGPRGSAPASTPSPPTSWRTRSEPHTRPDPADWHDDPYNPPDDVRSHTVSDPEPVHDQAPDLETGRGHDAHDPLDDLVPRQGEPFDNEAAAASFARIMNGDYGGLQAVVTHAIGSEFFGETRVTVTGTIHTADGTEVGMFIRVFERLDDGGFRAVHENLNIKNPFQGQGFAGEFNSRLEEYYRANDVRSIKLTANLDIGAYAWARAGYEFAVHSEMHEQIIHRLNEGIGKAEAELAKMEQERDQVAAQGNDFRRQGELADQIRWHRQELMKARAIAQVLDEATSVDHPGYPKPREIADLFRPRDLDPADSKEVFWLGKRVLIAAPGETKVSYTAVKYLR